MGKVLFLSWTIAHEQRLSTHWRGCRFMDNFEIWWTNAKFSKILTMSNFNCISKLHGQSGFGGQFRNFMGNVVHETTTSSMDGRGFRFDNIFSAHYIWAYFRAPIYLLTMDFELIRNRPRRNWSIYNKQANERKFLSIICLHPAWHRFQKNPRHLPIF